MVAGGRISGDRFLRPGSTIMRGKRGKEERRPEGFICTGGGRIWQGFNPIEEENQRGGLGHRRD
jgi:hypothetical protein